MEEGERPGLQQRRVDETLLEAAGADARWDVVCAGGRLDRLGPRVDAQQVDRSPALFPSVLLDGAAGVEEVAVGQDPRHQGGVAGVGAEVEQGAQVAQAAGDGGTAPLCIDQPVQKGNSYCRS